VVGGLIVGKEGLLVHVGACIALILKKGIGPMWYDMEVVFNISRMVEIIMILSHAM
jgi:H+/Cl- antiporter ClcA